VQVNVSALTQREEQPVALARVVTFEGGTADGIRAAAEEVKANATASGGPPEGVKSTGFTFLVDAEGGRVMFVGLFADEADLRASEPALEAMSPPEGMGERTTVEVWQVGVDVRM
jgi:hypothetical protein